MQTDSASPTLYAVRRGLWLCGHPHAHACTQHEATKHAYARTPHTAHRRDAPRPHGLQHPPISAPHGLSRLSRSAQRPRPSLYPAVSPRLSHSAPRPRHQRLDGTPAVCRLPSGRWCSASGVSLCRSSALRSLPAALAAHPTPVPRLSHPQPPCPPAHGPPLNRLSSTPSLASQRHPSFFHKSPHSVTTSSPRLQSPLRHRTAARRRSAATQA